MIEIFERNQRIYTLLGIIAFAGGMVLSWSDDPSCKIPCGLPSQSDIFLSNVGRAIMYAGLLVIALSILLNSRKRTNE